MFLILILIIVNAQLPTPPSIDPVALVAYRRQMMELRAISLDLDYISLTCKELQGNVDDIAHNTRRVFILIIDSD